MLHSENCLSRVPRVGGGRRSLTDVYPNTLQPLRKVFAEQPKLLAAAAAVSDSILLRDLLEVLGTTVGPNTQS